MYNSDKKKRGHAVALFSGGLDSILAILLVMKQDVEVTALTFMSHFGCDISDRSSCGSDPYPMAEKFGFNVKLVHLGQKFIDIVRHPKHGYGKNMNPCVDCRILMLTEARQFKELIGADFVITGEVLGQRPKSQMRNSMELTERKSGLEGRLVRPLSAKLFPETIPEKEGLLNRELLEDFSGRSRKRQIALARKLGVDDYPEPAGGCLLTDIGYSRRLRDLFNHSEETGFNDLNLLRLGRHFRLDDKTKIVVGKNERDNNAIIQLSSPDNIILEARGTGSPITLVIGRHDENLIKLAAAITARYCDAKNEPEVDITCKNGEITSVITIIPADQNIIDKYQIK